MAESSLNKDAVQTFKKMNGSFSVLDVDVSCFKNYTTPSNPVFINLLEWISSDKHKSKVEQLRTLYKSNNDEYQIKKKLLPAITPSGTFSHRNNDSLLKHTGLIQIDIDGKDNKDIEDFEQLKKQLSDIKQIAYLGLSVSGNGLWGLLPIAHSDKHESHFKYLELLFENELGIKIDGACKDVSRLRGYSYDPKPYINHKAETLQSYFTPPPKKTIIKKAYYSNSSAKTPPYEHFNNQVDIYEVIQEEFEIVGESKGKRFIKRFGANSTHSGYIYEGNFMRLFSDGTIYPANENLSPFDAYRIKYFNGDTKEATRDLREKGFGE